ncbi:MAG: hypothetical protein V3U52_02300 [Thermoplasmata archaeon]
MAIRTRELEEYTNEHVWNEGYPLTDSPARQDVYGSHDPTDQSQKVAQYSPTLSQVSPGDDDARRDQQGQGREPLRADSAWVILFHGATGHLCVLLVQ